MELGVFERTLLIGTDAWTRWRKRSEGPIFNYLSICRTCVRESLVFGRTRKQKRNVNRLINKRASKLTPHGEFLMEGSRGKGSP